MTVSEAIHPPVEFEYQSLKSVSIGYRNTDPKRKVSLLELTSGAVLVADKNTVRLYNCWAEMACDYKPVLRGDFPKNGDN